MAKLIKKNQPESSATPADAQGQTDPELTQIVEARRAPIIDRQTFEARSEAQSIRERAQQQAEELLAQAQQEAQALLESTQSDAAEQQAAAQAAGFAAGRQQGLDDVLSALAHAGLQDDAAQSQLIVPLSNLATQIARKILGRELEFHPDAVVQIVKQALGEKARQRRDITLRVHPDDAQLIREHKPELVEMLSRIKDIAIREDANVQRYGVIIETDAGSIDAQLDTQLAIFARILSQVEQPEAT